MFIEFSLTDCKEHRGWFVAQNARSWTRNTTTQHHLNRHRNGWHWLCIPIQSLVFDASVSQGKPQAHQWLASLMIKVIRDQSDDWTRQEPERGTGLLLNWVICYAVYLACSVVVCVGGCVCVYEWFWLVVMWRKIMRPVMRMSCPLDGYAPSASLDQLPTVTKLSSQQTVLDLSVFMDMWVCVWDRKTKC